MSYWKSENHKANVAKKKSARKIIFSILDFILTNDRISGYEGRERRKRKASLGCRRCKITVEKKKLLPRLEGIYSGIPVTYRNRSFHAMSMVGKLRWPWESQSIGKTFGAERFDSPLWYIRDRSFARRENSVTRACDLYANFTKKESFPNYVCAYWFCLSKNVNLPSLFSQEFQLKIFAIFYSLQMAFYSKSKIENARISAFKRVLCVYVCPDSQLFVQEYVTAPGSAIPSTPETGTSSANGTEANPRYS